jgi:hypothetical protein
MLEIAVQLGREARAVGEALGYEMQPIFGLTKDDFTKKDIAEKSDDALLKFRSTLLSHVGPVAKTAAINDLPKRSSHRNRRHQRLDRDKRQRT